MTRSRMIAGAAVVYAAMWMITWPALVADVNRGIEQHSGQCLFAYNHFRQDIGAAMAMALLPPTWLMAPFLTGFYEYGFQFAPDPVDGNGRCIRQAP